MKEFEQIDVFIPDDTMSKARMKFVYNVFIAMIKDIAKQLEENITKEEYSADMKDYVPDAWYGLAKNYGIKLLQTEGNDSLIYLALCYYVNDRDLNGYVPILWVNCVCGTTYLKYDCDCAAYILMIGYINHIGMISNLLEEEMKKDS